MNTTMKTGTQTRKMSDEMIQDLRRIAKGYRAKSVLSEPLLAERDLIELRRVRGHYVYRMTSKGRAVLEADADAVLADLLAADFAADEIVSVCACGCSYTREAWDKLPRAGTGTWTIDAGMILEIRNCPCGSTLAIDITNESGNPS